MVIGPGRQQLGEHRDQVVDVRLMVDWLMSSSAASAQIRFVHPVGLRGRDPDRQRQAPWATGHRGQQPGDQRETVRT